MISNLVEKIRPDQALLVSVWDWDRFTEDDFLGYFLVHLGELPLGKKIVNSYPLRPKPVTMDLSIKSASQLDVNAQPESQPAETKITSKATAFAKLILALPKDAEKSGPVLGQIRIKFKFTVRTAFFFFARLVY